MISEICASIKNYFSPTKIIDNFIIAGGEIIPQVPFLDGQYFRIVGSVFNDGVHRAGDDDLVDEPEFHGAVWLMNVPKDFLDLVKDIEDWQAKYGTVESANMSPYSSESFGEYSYSKAQGFASTGGGMLNSWQSVFAMRLNKYRKIREI